VQGSGAGTLFLQLGATVLVGFAARKALEALAGGRGRKGSEQIRKLINRLVLWVTMPALVFQTVHAAPLGADIIQAPAAAIAGMGGTALVAWVLLRRLYGRTPETGALVLAASAGSVSFFGIPIVRALFDASDARVAVYFAVLNVPLALVSAAIISSRIAGANGSAGSVSGFSGVARVALRQFILVPATWALVAALVFRDLALPHAVDGLLKAASSSVAPTTMFALGLGLRFERSFTPYRMALPAVAIKLAISPLVVFACAYAFGLSGLPLAIVSLQGAMPTQVLSVVVAERYRLNSGLVGLTLAMDTAIAFVLLPAILGVLRSTTGIAMA
jgi:predicted permease